MKKRQITVIGHNDDSCTKLHEKTAYETGVQVALSGSVLITGGMGGVMNAACHGAHDTGGITVGIIPQDDAKFANKYCSIVIPSGMGMSRDFLNALSADGLIIIGGGAGTLSEICAAYMYKKPMVAIRNTGGMADLYADRFVDQRRSVQIIGADTPKEAVAKIVSLA